MIPVYGRTYKVSETSPHDFHDCGATYGRGMTFVANASTVANAWIAKGIAWGYVVEVLAGTDYTDQYAIYVANQAAVRAYLQQNSSGDGERDIQQFKVGALAELTSELAADYTLTISTTAIGATSIAGNITASTAADINTLVVKAYVNDVYVGQDAALAADTPDWTVTPVTATVAGDIVDAKIFVDGKLVEELRAGVRFNAPTIDAGPFTATNTAVTGTSAYNGKIVYLYKAGTTLLGSATVGAGAWSVSGLALVGGDVLTAKVGLGVVESAASTSSTIDYEAPVITSAAPSAATSPAIVVSGTLAGDAAGNSLVTLYVNAVASAFTDTTSAGGAWSITGITAVATDVLTARAGAGASLSAASNSLVVTA